MRYYDAIIQGLTWAFLAIATPATVVVLIRFIRESARG